MHITKSAPLPERHCEQLTCCEKIGSVQGNYINCVKKRHNCRITGKEKATCHGGQCDQCGGLLVDYSASLALRRWRRLISPLTAVTINCALLSPSSKFFSKSATTSCGNLAFNCCDLLFVEPVAITESSLSWCDSVYTKKISEKGLKCDSLTDRLKMSGAMHQATTPRSGGTHAGRLTKPLTGVTIMAVRQHTPRLAHTQTAFVWRFIAFGASDHQIIHVTAWTEREARSRCPSGCVA
ncbi:host cell division inhibitor Icd-like protein, partial [Escherichia coli]